MTTLTQVLKDLEDIPTQLTRNLNVTHYFISLLAFGHILFTSNTQSNVLGGGGGRPIFMN